MNHLYKDEAYKMNKNLEIHVVFIGNSIAMDFSSFLQNSMFDCIVAQILCS